MIFAHACRECQQATRFGDRKITDKGAINEYTWCFINNYLTDGQSGYYLYSIWGSTATYYYTSAFKYKIKNTFK